MNFENVFLSKIIPYNVASHLVWEVPEKERSQILKLDWNEATIPPSPVVKKRIIDALNNDDFLNLYPNTLNQSLLDKIGEYVGVDSKSIQIFVGSDSAHEHIVRTYLCPNDKVLILGPTYDNFRLTAEAQGGIVSFFNIEEDNRFDLKTFLNFSNDLNPKLIYICNPNNPTGKVLENSIFIEIIKENPHSIILVDEAYYEFYKISLKDYINTYKNLVITRTFSKAFALANLRAGYIISNFNVIKEISKIRNSKSICTITQISLVAILDDIGYMHNYIEQVTVARDYFNNILHEFDFIERVYPSQGNFILVRFKSNIIKRQVVESLNSNLIFVRELSHSSLLENCVRFTIGLPSQMQRVVDVLKTVN
jgi:histidinol-phosphate aminotransferase